MSRQFMPSLPENRPVPDFTYPAGHVVAIVETPLQLASVVSELRRRGFQTGEIGVLDCRDAAALGATTGHSGLVAWLIRLADRLGVRDDEAEVKGRYEQELREGHYSVKVRAPDPSGPPGPRECSRSMAPGSSTCLPASRSSGSRSEGPRGPTIRYPCPYYGQ